MRVTGLSRGRVRTLLRSGLPKRSAAEIKKWIKANIDPKRKNHWGKGKSGSSNGVNGHSLVDARRENEQVKVEIGKLELAKRRGELIQRAKVQKFIDSRARMERDHWIAWPAAAAARMCAELRVDHDRLLSALEKEVREHLTKLAATPVEEINDDDSVAG